MDTYNEFKIEGSSLTKNELKLFIEELSGLTTADIKAKYKRIVEGREDLLLAGTIILHSVLDYFGIDEALVSTKGIRYGAVVKYLLEKF